MSTGEYEGRDTLDSFGFCCKWRIWNYPVSTEVHLFSRFLYTNGGKLKYEIMVSVVAFNKLHTLYQLRCIYMTY